MCLYMSFRKVGFKRSVRIEMETCREKWSLYLELMEHKIHWDVVRRGKEETSVTSLLCLRILQTCGKQLATEPLLLFRVAAGKVMDEGYEIGPDLVGVSTAPQPLAAVEDLLPGARAALREMLLVAAPCLHRLHEEAKLQQTRDIARDIIFCLDTVSTWLREHARDREDHNSRKKELVCAR